MVNAHYRLPKQSKGKTLYQVSACNSAGFTTPDVEAVTCPRCHHTEGYTAALAEFRAVVDSLAYPKEEHPCLSTSANRSTRS
jgi:hypothetical protein